jgi:hypothetical protein
MELNGSVLSYYKKKQEEKQAEEAASLVCLLCARKQAPLVLCERERKEEDRVREQSAGEQPNQISGLSS